MKSPLLHSVIDTWHPGLTRNVAAWADRNRRLTKHSSQYVGKWKTDRFPYQRGPMDAISSSKTRLIVLRWGTQLGKTEAQLNSIGYWIDEAPGPILAVYPSEKIVRKISTTRIQPMIDTCPALKLKKDPSPHNDKIEQKHFADCILYAVSAQTPGDLASMPIQYLICDEIDKFPKFAKEEGSPIDLAMERQKSFPHTSKTILVSSPTTDEGPVSRYFKACEEQLSFFLPCPHCGTMQTLDFKHVKWDTKGLPSTEPASWRLARKSATYVCPHCEQVVTDNQKNRILINGEWLREDGTAPDPDAASIGFHLNSLYSPLVTWGTAAARFLEVKNDPPRLMVFKNGWLAENWTDAAIEKKNPSKILTEHVTTIPARTVPRDTWALTMGIDSQATGFFYVVRAWQRDRTSLLIDYGFLPSLEDVRQAAFERSYPIEGEEKRRMGIWRAAIDTGGTRLDDGPSMTEQVYSWLRRIPNGLIYGIKGLTWRKSGVRVQRKVIDNMPGTYGKPLPGGIVLMFLDTAAFKEVIHYRLTIKKEEPGAFLFHADTTEEYTKQLLSEYKKRELKTGKESWVAIKGRDNHYLDCEVYAMACQDTQFFGGLDLLKRPQGITKNGMVELPINRKKASRQPHENRFSKYQEVYRGIAGARR